MRDEDYILQQDPDPTPIDIPAEQTILGACFLMDEAPSILATETTADDFCLDSHRRIALAIIELQSGGHAVDIITVRSHLVSKGELDAVGGGAYLASLTEGLPRRLRLAEYISILKNKSRLRRLLSVAGSLSSKVYGASETALEVSAWALNEIAGIAESSDSTAQVFSSADMEEAALDRLLNPSADSDVLPFGISPLDEFTNGGMRLGELWIIGAPPSRGKTTLARQIVCHTVCRGIGAYVHSGEMTKESWQDITACLIEEFPTWKIRDRYLMNLTDKETVSRGLKTLAKLPFFISDTGGIELDRLMFNAVKAKKNNDIGLFVIDYAQLIHSPGRDKREQVSAVANRCREFAKEYNVATLLLSQMARPEGRNINARPNMFMLKESGTLEEAAQGIIFPYMPVDTETNQFTGEAELVIGKQRFGAVGSVPVKFRGDFLRFEERRTGNV